MEQERKYLNQYVMQSVRLLTYRMVYCYLKMMNTQSIVVF